MNQLDILLPFGLPPAELAGDLLRELKLPAVSMLMARAKTVKHRSYNDFLRALPHEQWLGEQLGLLSLWRNTSPSTALQAMQFCKLAALPGHWFMLHPVHIHIARDHLVLTDQRNLPITDVESRLLFDAAQPHFEEAGKKLLYGDAKTWFVQADDWFALQTATMDIACGRNIDLWMPAGDKAQEWRKLLNEINMLWHTHPVNEKREIAGSKPINSLWLWGGATNERSTAQKKYDTVFSLNKERHAFMYAMPEAQPFIDLDTCVEHASQRSLLVLNTLIAPALGDDWAEWLDRVNAIEESVFAPLLTALKNGRANHVRLIFSNGNRLTEWDIDKWSLWKLWLKPSLKALHAPPTS